MKWYRGIGVATRDDPYYYCPLSQPVPEPTKFEVRRIPRTRPDMDLHLGVTGSMRSLFDLRKIAPHERSLQLRVSPRPGPVLKVKIQFDGLLRYNIPRSQMM